MSNEMLPNVIKGRIWLGDLEDPLNLDPVLFDQTANLTVEQSDVDEIDLHATLPVHDNALVTLSMTREQARQVGTHLINAANDNDGSTLEYAGAVTLATLRTILRERGALEEGAGDAA